VESGTLTIYTDSAAIIDFTVRLKAIGSVTKCIQHFSVLYRPISVVGHYSYQRCMQNTLIHIIIPHKGPFIACACFNSALTANLPATVAAYLWHMRLPFDCVRVRGRGEIIELCWRLAT